MGREIKRVPLDFQWPLNEVWSGYLMPAELQLPECPECLGDGYSAEARAIAQTFYPHMIAGDNADVLAWHDKIGRAEVDNLVKHGRLRILQRRLPTADNPRDWEWISVPRMAAEINTLNHRHGSDSHDGINRSILVDFRCERLGIVKECARCDGYGDIGTEAQRAAYDQWEGTDPPTGDGWQVWETVSEGSPVTPVYPTSEALIAALTQDGYSESTARRFTEVGSVPSMVMTGGVLKADIETLA